MTALRICPPLVALCVCVCACSASENGDVETMFAGDSADLSCDVDSSERMDARCFDEALCRQQPDTQAFDSVARADVEYAETPLSEFLDAANERCDAVDVVPVSEFLADKTNDAEGEYLNACSSESSCDYGPCVPYDFSASASFCTKLCSTHEECGYCFVCPPPAGFGKDVDCVDQNVACVCLPTTIFLCKSCDDSAECSSPASPETVGVCLVAGGENEGHCAAKCEDTVACPPGYECKSTLVDSTEIALCVPANGLCAEP